jgi:nucleoside-diphosphate-sugar epimerase
MNYALRKRILVTGGAGFLGSHLLSEARADCDSQPQAQLSVTSSSGQHRLMALKSRSLVSKWLSIFYFPMIAQLWPVNREKVDGQLL